jgi:predicted double-glycine peptidase
VTRRYEVKGLPVALFMVLSTVIQSLLTDFVYSADTTLIQDGLAVRKSVKSWTEFRDENLVKQQYDYSCGAASLATVLKYFFNEEVTEKEIIKALPAQRELNEEKNEDEPREFSFLDLKEYAQSRGYKAIALALPIKTLRQLQVPAILYIETRDYEHFTVFKGIKGGFVYFADPSFGNMQVRIARFKESFYTRSDLDYPGRALVLIPKDMHKQNKVNASFMAVPARSDFVYKVVKDDAISIDSAIP